MLEVKRKEENVILHQVSNIMYLDFMNILVTAGPTQEPIDPVRFISNRSSGKMGYAIADSASCRGHDVVLVSGPVHISAPPRVKVVPVNTAEEMLVAVQENVDWCDVLVMAAAVADKRPAEVSETKLKKSAVFDKIDLVETPDILKTVQDGKGSRVFVGFAAETENVLKEAERKLKEKGLDLIVANDVTRPDSGFDVDTNKVTFVTGEKLSEELPLMTKQNVSVRILEWIESYSALR